jgi:hypothetical protein
VSLIRLNGRDISQGCIEETSKKFCSLCDGGISTGQIEGLCTQQWTDWYNACKFDYFTADSRANELGAGEVTFWDKKSLLWAQLKDIYTDPANFWKQMGISVNEQNDWYDGVPWQNKYGKAKKAKKTRIKTTKASQVPQEESWFDGLTNNMLALYDKYPRTFVIVYGLLLATFLVLSLRFLFGMFRFTKATPVYMDDDMKVKRQKILEKRSEKRKH